MTLADWAGIGTMVLIAMFGGAVHIFRDWAKGLGKRLDHLDECIDDLRVKVAEDRAFRRRRKW